LIDVPDDVREVNVPGFAGKVTKRLSQNLPDIVQYGIADVDSISTIRANQGDPTSTSQVGNANTIGLFNTCWKVETKITPIRASTTAKKVRYEIRWRQIST
jgi:hypothetical protein